jgi:hypothetical protein
VAGTECDRVEEVEDRIAQENGIAQEDRIAQEAKGSDLGGGGGWKVNCPLRVGLVTA